MCSIELAIRDNEKFCHQLVLIKGIINCSQPHANYPDHNNPSNGRFIKFTRFDGVEYNWPINSINEFKAVVRLKKGLNNFNVYYAYMNEEASLDINLLYEENMSMTPLGLCIFMTKDSKHVFDMDKESKATGEKNDLDSAIKRLRTAGLLWQALTSESLNYHGLGRKSFRLDLESNQGNLYYKVA